MFEPYFLTLLATKHGAAEGQRLVTQVLATVPTSGERLFEAELTRIEGELLRVAGADPVQAEACFRRALAAAHASEARFWQLRAAASLVRLMVEQGRRAEAHDLFEPIYGWFTEGFDTLDLIEAKALLEALA